MAMQGYASYSNEAMEGFCNSLASLGNRIIDSLENFAGLCSKLANSTEVTESAGLSSLLEVLEKIQADTVNNDDSMKARITKMNTNCKKQLEQLNLVFNVGAKKKTDDAVEELKATVKKVKESTSAKK